ncbi:inter-alpha-trypsin inhibitor heavy chain H3-like isoform X1 [Ascaphus truei]|uniref:inter-alpha-trypsin inhibitor heavy chain H3-like isoform X1 n=1 Tax=Ascaphus truei TaxID=8439 RepID=UPI003F5AB2A3
MAFTSLRVSLGPSDSASVPRLPGLLLSLTLGYGPHYGTSSTRDPAVPLIPSPTLSSSSCQDFHFLINVFNLTEKICLVIKEKQNTIINLFHYENSGITLNGEMIQGENNADIYFGKYGLLNKKMKLKVEITRENITVHHIGYIKTYQWTSSFEEKRFLNKEGEQIRITVETGIQLIISLNEQRGDLTLYIEDKHLLSNRTIGLAGQFFGDEKIHMDMGLLTVHGRFLPSHSENQCDFTRYGLEQDASCRVISIGTDGFISGTSYIVSDIFYFPHVTSYA